MQLILVLFIIIEHWTSNIEFDGLTSDKMSGNGAKNGQWTMDNMSGCDVTYFCFM
jgi:hypothetical protein